MEVSSLIALVGAFIGSGGLVGWIGTVMYYKPKLRVAKADAEQKETELAVNKQSSLIQRLENMERIYKEQGEMVDSLRKQVLDLKQELLDVQTENRDLKSKIDTQEKVIHELKQENKALREKIELYQGNGDAK